MSELPPSARGAFAEARRQLEPDAARLERVRQRVHAQVSSQSVQRSFWSAKPLWLVAVMLGLLAVVLGLALHEPSQPAPPAPDVAAASATRHARAEPAATEPSHASPPASPAPSQAPPRVLAEGGARAQPSLVQSEAGASSAPGPVTEHAQGEPSRRRVSPKRVRQPPPPSGRLPPKESAQRDPPSQLVIARADPEPRDALQREAALIERARAALAQENRELLERALREHESEYPAGQLLIERLALKSQAACLAGDAAAFRAAFKQLLLLRPPRALRGAVERACSPLLSSP